VRIRRRCASRSLFWAVNSWTRASISARIAPSARSIFSAGITKCEAGETTTRSRLPVFLAVVASIVWMASTCDPKKSMRSPSLR